MKGSAVEQGNKGRRRKKRAELLNGRPEVDQDRLRDEIGRLRVRRRAFEALEAEQAEAEPVPPSAFTLDEELALPDPEPSYPIDRLLVEDSNVLLIAQYKGGKTTLGMNATAALADEEPFLGQYAVDMPEGRIGFWNYELDARMFRRWVWDMEIANPERISPYHLRGYRYPLWTPTWEDRAVEWLAEREVAVWWVDPFGRAFSGCGSEVSNDDVGRFLETLDVIKRRAGVRNIILSSHMSREAIREGSEASRGAARLQEWCDAWWNLTRDPASGGARYLSAEGRDVDVEGIELQYLPPTRTYRATGRTKAAAVETTAALEVVDALALAGEGTVTKTIRDALKGSGQAQNRKVQDVEKNGYIKRVDEGTGKPTRCYLTDKGKQLHERRVSK